MEQRQPLQDNHIWNTEDKVLPGPCGLGIPGSSSLLVFDVASCSITGFSVVALPSFLRRSVEDKPAIRSVCAYIPRLFECAEIDFQDRSALYGYIISAVQQAKHARLLPRSLGLEKGISTDYRETRAILRTKTRTEFDDDVQLHSWNTENCSSLLLDRLAVKRDLWEDFWGAHHEVQ
ncbi:uncharacterized protein LOC142769102 [Rhipicephalus microplus]|uniref:uncharacterized protein LOC142769102 n=1 Tax=Rhipicephalus microplus TaxID=6941 RepID=UPI003F6D1262